MKIIQGCVGGHKGILRGTAYRSVRQEGYKSN